MSHNVGGRMCRKCGLHCHATAINKLDSCAVGSSKLIVLPLLKLILQLRKVWVDFVSDRSYGLMAS